MNDGSEGAESDGRHTAGTVRANTCDRSTFEGRESVEKVKLLLLL